MFPSNDFTTSESIKELIPALIAFQGERPHVKRSKTGNVGGRPYQYASLVDIILAVTPILNKHGLYMMQAIVSDKIVTTIFHKSGEYVSSALKWESVEASSRAVNNAQSAGQGFTYYKRYALSAILMLADEDDNDGNGSSVGSPSKQTAQANNQAAPPAAKPAVKYESVTAEDAIIRGLTPKDGDPKPSTKVPTDVVIWFTDAPNTYLTVPAADAPKILAELRKAKGK